MNKPSPQIEQPKLLPQKIGSYEVIRKLAQGGMGEVFLAKDPHCQRTVAIKRIKPTLSSQPIVRKRFLKEAKITASLCHPCVIPIYSIQQSDLYYVMPYVEGHTLKSLLRQMHRNEKNGIHSLTKSSIDSLIQIFIDVCQAISYCHSKKILHRDLKPENILIGNFGQVLIVDWGLACYLHDKDLPESLPSSKAPLSQHLTHPGKVLGTLSYMPPERVEGKPADIQTDIYSLGVILYQILTLKMPFYRPSIKKYKQVKKFEILIDALEAAPYRDIPHQLSNMAKRCLTIHRENRYPCVEDLIYDLKRHNSGLPEWIFIQKLNIDEKKDWQLQENVLLSKLIPITRSTEIMQWHILMISKTSFSGNKKVEVTLLFQKETDGIGFLLNVPDPKEQKGLEDGYCIWIGSYKNPGIRLYRSYVTILEIPEKHLKQGQEALIEIEKIDQRVQLFINKTLIIDYTDSLPIVGTHIGLLCQDMEFRLNSFNIFVASQAATVKCLSVPDAFLTSKNFDEAIVEYTRISKSFPGRSEGREAFFKAAIAYLEKAKLQTSSLKKANLFNKAFSLFEKLHSTPSEPLEYLGKSLIYQKMGEFEEELKCLELGLRKFKKHPLIHVLEERILFRLHESAKNDRIAVYHFAFLTLIHLPHLLANRETHSLIHTLFTYTEKLLFMHNPKTFDTLSDLYRHMAIQFAFWIDKKLALKELLQKETHPLLKENIVHALVALGSESAPQALLKSPTSPCQLFFQFYFLLTKSKANYILQSISSIKAPTQERSLHFFKIWAYLLLNNWEQANLILSFYPEETLQKCSSPFFFLYGCFLAATKGFDKASKHLKKISDGFYPTIYEILGYYLKAPPVLFKKWELQAFKWEKIALLQQKILFFHCLGKTTKVLYLKSTLKKTGFYSKL